MVPKGEHLLITYDISAKSPSEKVRFVYLLKGRRDETGIVETLGGTFLAPGCFIVPKKTEKEIKQIFKLWKVKPKIMKIAIG